MEALPYAPVFQAVVKSVLKVYSVFRRIFGRFVISLANHSQQTHDKQETKNHLHFMCRFFYGNEHQSCFSKISK